MMAAFFTNLTVMNSILFIIFFISISSKNVDSLNCQVIYVKNHEIHCLKTRISLRNFNRTFPVLKYQCKGTNDTYEHCHESGSFMEFHLNDCVLRPNILRFCGARTIQYFISSKGHKKNAVLRNGTFRTNSGIKGIYLSGSGIKSVQSRAFGCLKGLHDLNLSHNPLEVLPDDVFECLGKLRYLNLSNNLLLILPKSLNNLPLLMKLDISHNFITNFPENLLHNKSEIMYLDLNRNRIEKFCSSKIVQLDSLNVLNLSGNNISNFSEGCFIKQDSLRVLLIDKNPGLVLSNDTFAGLKNLRYLHIDECELSIKSEESGVFSNTPSLQVLDLQRNCLHEIHSDLFKALREIKHLNLSFNAISVIHSRSFETNTELRTLDLSNNRIKEIKSDDFSGLSSLMYLNISHNHIRNVSQDSLGDLGSLRTLDIGHNMLSPLPRPSSHPIHAFQNIFPKLEYLRNLEMSNSTSSMFELSFTQKNSHISHLDMSFNVGLRLKKNSLKDLSQLETLNLQDSNIEDTSDLFLDLLNKEKLREINLSGNNIRVIDFIRCSNLRKLDLSRNSITKIPVFEHYVWDKLNYFNLSHNCLQQISEKPYFIKFEELRVFDISFNNFTRIDWKDLSFIETVWISNNNLTSLSLSDFVDTRIRTLRLEDNAIKRVSVDLNFQNRAGKLGMTVFFLKKNPVVCDCNAFRLYEYVRNKSTNQRFILEGITCRHPPELDGKKLEILSPDDFVCEDRVSCPEQCRCTKRAYDGATVVNCSRGDLNFLPDDVPVNTTVLLVGNNRISSLESLNRAIWENVTKIHAEGNLISSDQFHVPKNVKVFLLHGNRLTKLPESLREHVEATKDLLITLSDNPWPCECALLPFKNFISKHVLQIYDAFEVRCTFSTNSTSNVTLVEMKNQDLCPASDLNK